MDASERSNSCKTQMLAATREPLWQCWAHPLTCQGLSPEMQALYTRQYHDRKHPETAARLKVMQTAYDMLNKRSGLVMGEIEKAIGTDWRTVQRLKQAREESEKAFILSSKL